MERAYKFRIEPTKAQVTQKEAQRLLKPHVSEDPKH